MAETIRAFIAVPTGTKIQQSIAALQKKAGRQGCSVKWVRPDNVHLTLQFLGDRTEDELAKIRELMTFIANKTKSIKAPLTHLGGFPDLIRPRVLWVGLKDPNQKIARVAKKLRESILQINIDLDKKAFVPHLTVGRVKSVKEDNPFGYLAQEDRSFRELALDVRRLNLYKSTLTETGPVYEILHSVDLRA